MSIKNVVILTHGFILERHWVLWLIQHLLFKAEASTSFEILVKLQLGFVWQRWIPRKLCQIHIWMYPYISIYGIHLWYPFWEWEKATFTAFPHFRKGTSSARSENLRPVLESGLWRGNVVSDLLTSEHCKVVFSPFLILYTVFSHFMYLRKFKFRKRGRTSPQSV